MFSMIPGLNGLRTIAFPLVFAMHTGYLDVGWVWATLFVVLSGFPITVILLDMKMALVSKEFFSSVFGKSPQPKNALPVAAKS